MSVITGLCIFPGLVFDHAVQGLYALSGLVVALAVSHDLARAFFAALLQGGATLMLFFCFGPQQPFAVVMLVGHVLASMVFCHWVALIQDATR